MATSPPPVLAVGEVVTARWWRPPFARSGGRRRPPSIRFGERVGGRRGGCGGVFPSVRTGSGGGEAVVARWRRPGGGRGGEAVAVVEKSGAEDDALDVNVCDVLFMTFLKFLHVLFLGDVDDYVMVQLKPFLSLFKKKNPAPT